MPAERRRSFIVGQLRRNGFVSVGEVAATLSVSEMTIRRDLVDLEKEGQLSRTHGGAIVPEGASAHPFDRDEPAFEARLRRNHGAKERIAAAAMSLILPRQTIALDVGTSTYLLAARLAAFPNIKVFTNSLRSATLLGKRGRDVYLPGGEIRGDEMTLCGPTAVAHFEQLWFDIAFIGVAGITEAGLFDYSLEDSELKRVYLRRSRRKVLLCDAAKFNHMSLVKVAELNAADLLISDASPPAELAAALLAAGIEIRIAGELSPNS